MKTNFTPEQIEKMKENALTMYKLLYMYYKEGLDTDTNEIQTIIRKIENS
jgi:hypothetical protein